MADNSTDIHRFRLSIPQMFLFLAGIGSVTVSVVGGGYAVYRAIDARLVIYETRAGNEDVKLALVEQTLVQHEKELAAARVAQVAAQKETNDSLHEISTSLNNMAVKLAERRSVP